MSDRVFAVVGDVHDHFREMVCLVSELGRKHGVAPEFILQVGDFQANRNDADMASMDSPSKFRKFGDFGSFWSGKSRFPWPVYFIGGNHEPYGWLERHTGGALLLENVHYLGRVGRVELGGLAIVGLSGIHEDGRENTQRPPPEAFGSRHPADWVHYTNDDIDHALTLGPADVLMLHDWPAGLAENDTIGSIRTRALVEMLEPRLVVCGHMHRPLRAAIPLLNGGRASVECLDQVKRGPEAVALFRTPSLERLA